MIKNRICSEIVPHYVDITDNSQRISFVENLRLSGKKIEWLTIVNPYKGEGLTHYSQTADGKTILQDPNELRNSYLVLVNKSREIINRVSLMDIILRETEGNPLQLRGNEIDISSSYLMRANPQSTSVGSTIIFNFGVSSNKSTEELMSIKENTFEDYIGVVVPSYSGYRDIYFPDQQSFRNRKLTGINLVNCDITPDMYNSAFAFQAEDYSTLPLVTLIDTKGKLVTDHLAITSITETTTLGQTVFFDSFAFDGVEIDWARSFISTSDSAPGTQFFFNLRLTKNW